MNRNEQLLQSYIDIDTATEISYATLAELSENSECDRTKYVLLGVMEQLEKIKKSAELIDSAMSGEVVA